MCRRLAMLMLAVAVFALVVNPADAGFKLKKLAKAALLGAAIAPRFVPIPIPHHVHHGYDHHHHHGGYGGGHGGYGHGW